MRHNECYGLAKKIFFVFLRFLLILLVYLLSAFSNRLNRSQFLIFFFLHFLSLIIKARDKDKILAKLKIYQKNFIQTNRKNLFHFVISLLWIVF